MGKTFKESVIEIGEAIHQDVLGCEDPEAIDWTNIKELVGQLLQSFGPLLMKLLLTWLTPTTK